MNVIKYVEVNHQIIQFGNQKSSLDAQIYIKINQLINQIITRNMLLKQISPHGEVLQWFKRNGLKSNFACRDVLSYTMLHQIKKHLV